MKTKILIKIIKTQRKSQMETRAIPENGLFSFIGLHLTVTEVRHQRNLHMKSDYSISDFK